MKPSMSAAVPGVILLFPAGPVIAPLLGSETAAAGGGWPVPPLVQAGHGQ